MLREAFDVSYDEIAAAVDKSPAAVRQIAHLAVLAPVQLDERVQLEREGVGLGLPALARTLDDAPDDHGWGVIANGSQPGGRCRLLPSGRS